MEFHIKRAQLRWSAHLVRMTGDRIPKALFYGQLITGCRTIGGQRKRYKDVIKSTLKSCSLILNTWEATATSLASHLSHRSTGFRAETNTINQRPKNSAEEWSTSAGTCDHLYYILCGRQRASRIGLHSTRETTTDSGRDSWFDSSFHIQRFWCRLIAGYSLLSSKYSPHANVKLKYQLKSE